MALRYDKDQFSQPPMGGFGANLVPKPPAGAMAGQAGGLGAQIPKAPPPGSPRAIMAANQGLSAAGPVASPAAPQPGRGKKKAAAAARPAKPLTGEALVNDLLVKTIRGEQGSFGPDVMNNIVSQSLGNREAAKRTGLDDVNRQIASRGLGRSALGAGMAGNVIRGAQQDYSQNMSQMYGDKAKQDFSDRMGALAPYGQALQRQNAQRMNAARLAEQGRQFDLNRQDNLNRPRGGGGGSGAGDEDMLFKLLMGGGDFGF